MPAGIITAILKAISTVSELGTKAINPDSVRERNSQISEPKKLRRTREWIDGQNFDDWRARVKTFDLNKRGKRKTITEKELIKYVREIIEWGAKIEDIRKTETEIQVDYCRDNISYPTEVFYLTESE